MKKAPSNFEPAPPNRLWRYAWIGVALVIFSLPFFAWLAIGIAGRRAWKKAETELRDAGEALTFDELPRPESINDSDNYGSIAPLKNIARAGGGEPERQRDRLRYLAADGQSWFPLKGNQLLLTTLFGEPARIDLWAKYFFALDGPSKVDPNDPQATEYSSPRPYNSRQTTPAKRARHGTYVLAEIERRTSLFRELTEGLDRPFARFSPSIWERIDSASSVDELPDGHLYAVQVPASMLMIRSIAATRSGDSETALQSIEILLRLAEACASDLSTEAVSFAGHQTEQAVSGVVEAFWAELWNDDPARLKRLQQALERVDLEQATAQAIRVDVVHALAAIEEIEADRSSHREWLRTFPGDSRFTPPEHSKWFPAGWFDHNRAHFVTAANRFLLEPSRVPTNPAKVLSHFEMLVRWLHQLPRNDSAHFAWSARALLSIKTVPIQAEAYRRMAIIVCALHRYRNDHDDFPSTLSELIPTYLSSAPTDPMDGKPMRYAPVGDGTFLLYSVGHDRADDGGVFRIPPDDSIPVTGGYTDWPWPNKPNDVANDSSASEKGERTRFILPVDAAP